MDETQDTMGTDAAGQVPPPLQTGVATVTPMVEVTGSGTDPKTAEFVAGRTVGAYLETTRTRLPRRHIVVMDGKRVSLETVVEAAGAKLVITKVARRG